MEFDRAYAASVARAARHLVRAGCFAEAEALLQRRLPRLQARLGDVREVGALWNLLGVTAKHTGRYDLADVYYHCALACAGADSATLFHNLAGLAHARGNFAEADMLARCGLAIRRRAGGDIGADLAAHATILDDLGRHGEARAAFERALALFRERYGELHAEVGHALGSLGAFYASAERWHRATRLLERARRIYRAVLAADHPEVARVEQYLAVVAWGRGDRRAARRHVRSALAICERSLPPDHPLAVDARATHAAIT